ncbi:MAG: nucleotidyltransferase domain-containing protein [Spirochaetes bacterium]|nr:MAG: nucleotidyltransferase domain-containing protein [Spirochaetota bacterium]
MTTLTETSIDPKIKAALKAAKAKITAHFDVETMILFGSVARGDGDEESDADILVLTRRLLTREERHGITDIVFEINLEMGTNLSTVVVDSESWEHGMYSVLPLRSEIRRDGILI